MIKHNILHNRTAKDIIWQVGGSIVNRASFFVTLVLLSGYLNPKIYGSLCLIYNMALSISSINSTGFGIVTRRELVKEDNKAIQKEILNSNLILITILAIILSIFVFIYQYSVHSIECSNVLFLSLLFLLSVNASFSYYLNYHYAGLGKFVEYNKILLPINVLLPILCLLLEPSSIIVSGGIFMLVMMIGNIVQILYLTQLSAFSFDYSFQKKHFKEYSPCFMQAIFGLPVFVILQSIIVYRWDNIAIIGLITLMQQILNMSNIFASKTLTVFSPKITKYKLENKTVSPKEIMPMFIGYMLIVFVVSGLILICLPIIVRFMNETYSDSIDDMRYFIIMNIITSISWFVIEYYHAIGKSWISFSFNVSVSVLIFIVFYLIYYNNMSFSLRDYANCLVLSRLILLVPLLCKNLKFFFSR